MTTFLRVSSILEGINGVLEYAVDPASHTATVTFDNKKTTVEKIEKALSDREFPVEGDPRFLK
jgi:copper chaperone CopZ